MYIKKRRFPHEPSNNLLAKVLKRKSLSESFRGKVHGRKSPNGDVQTKMFKRIFPSERFLNDTKRKFVNEKPPNEHFQTKVPE